MTNNTQFQQVLDHLKKFNTITALEALELCGCLRLSPIIQRLRNTGYDIVTHRERNNKCTGTHARYEYRGVQR
ncbi:helix-turn-helix domain-containing protein [Acinetobacter sp. YH12105]|uniref:helix-turn-helix domain-containing protein n=1 Tax=Acinetobacter sp. YH12105 TaxID=2601093 RepID=UPI0015D31D04|nr:helix-turn-helix domain-containing protein [Acinetobacter sp. YH12105]